MQYRYGRLETDENTVEERAGHPSLETLAAYRDGALSEEIAEEAQRHIVRCEECVDLLLMYGADADDESTGVLDFEKEMIWARIKAEKAGESAAKAWRRRRAERLGIAAVLLLTLAPLGWFNVHQKYIIADLTQPQLNVSIQDVLENDQRSANLTAESSGPRAFEIPRNTEFYTVVFPVDGSKDGNYRVDLFDSTSSLIWSGKDLDVDEYGYATLGLSRRFLDPGAYQIRVYDEVNRKSVGDHSFVVDYK